jgi:hypothetical protein
MKNKLIRVLLLSILMECSLICAPVVVLTSCTQPAISQQSTDQIILRAEQTAQVARDTFNLFVHLERDNEAMLKSVNPAIHDYANTIRAHGLDWIDSLRAATKAFKANRTSQSQADLSTALATLTTAISETNKYIAMSKQAVSRP